jgi:SAM-dependent methyltransferase
MPTDWEQRYQSGDMPWEKGAASPGLVDFLAARPKLPRGSVLVPGCGTGHDARVWAAAGFTVAGCDISPSAIRLAVEKTCAAGLTAEFIPGDFLRDMPPRRFDWIFEHTLYCAIDPDRRDDYAAAVLRRLKPGGDYLSVNYMIPDREGPPFGANRAEILARFSSHFDLREEWVPRSYPNRTNLERMFWWRRREGSANRRPGN